MTALAATAIAAAPAFACRAAAQDYPWCANFHDGAGSNCGFSSAAQCQATVLGGGGFCSPNNLYKPPAPPPHKAARSLRKVSGR